MNDPSSFRFVVKRQINANRILRRCHVSPKLGRHRLVIKTHFTFFFSSPRYPFSSLKRPPDHFPKCLRTIIIIIIITRITFFLCREISFNPSLRPAIFVFHIIQRHQMNSWNVRIISDRRAALAQSVCLSPNGGGAAGWVIEARFHGNIFPRK